MSVFLLSGQNCFTAPIAISATCTTTVANWTEKKLPTVKNLIHPGSNVTRIVLHTFSMQCRKNFDQITLTWVSTNTDQRLELSCVDNKIDIQAFSHFIDEILQDQKDVIWNTYVALYNSP